MRKTLLVILMLAITFTTFSIGINAASTSNGSVSSVKVETARIEKNEENCTIKLIYPVFSGFSSAKKLNDTMQNKNLDSIGYIRSALASLQEYINQLKAAGETYVPKVETDSYFDYSINGDILSLVLNSYIYSGGAHGSTLLDSYTVNTRTGEMYTFASLFNSSSNYKKVILDKINKMIDKEKDLYFEDAKKTLAAKNSNYKFYINGNMLVIYFDEYDLRPYAGGIPEFSINVKDLKGLLKDDIYKQLINAKPIGNVRLNGTGMGTQLKTYEQDYSLMVPLKAIAETLGYKVGWDSKKGASVAGGYIKNNVDTYYTSGSKKIKLTPAKIIGNVLYVPSSYFSEVLKEDVFYDGKALRIFKKPLSAPSLFDNQILEFTRLGTAKECAQMYAKAVMERKGAIQYGLLSSKLRAAKKAGFEDMNWVTGVSSPWVTGFDITDNGKGIYKIVFHWATSTGKSPDSTTSITIESVPGQEYWEITNITE